MKNKVISFLLALTLILTLFCTLPLSAAAETSGDFTYTVGEDGKLTITGYSGSAANLTIPSQLDGKSVYMIGSESFRGYKFIKTVTVSEGIQRIGTAAFEYGGLTSISLPNSLVQIGDMAFNGCEHLSEITLPRGLEKFGNYVFWSSGVKNIYVDSENPNFKSVDGVLFTKDGKKLVAYPTGRSAAYTIPNGTEEIGTAAFMNSSVTAITIPTSVNRMGSYAFSGCASLKTANFAGGPAVLGQYVFSKCKKLTELEIPEGTTEIGNYLISDCEALKTLSLPTTVEKLSEKTFDKAPKGLILKLPTSQVVRDAAVAAGIAVADMDAVSAVIKQISGLVLIYSLEQKPEVEAARSAYDALSATEQSLVTNYDMLLDAEKTIAGIESGEILPGLRGDLDGNEKLDVGDIMKMKALIMADAYTEEELASGDMDGNGQLDVGDIMQLKSIIMVL